MSNWGKSKQRKSRLSSTQVERAKANGITYAVLYWRYYRCDWNIERAVTEPIRQKSTSTMPQRIKAEEKSGKSIEAVSEEYDVEPNLVRDIWRYYV